MTYQDKNRMRYNRYTPMSHQNWKDVHPIFKPAENWGDPDKIDARLVYEIYDVRRYAGRPTYIHCGYEKRKMFSWHKHFVAADIHIEGYHYIDQFLILSRFGFTGLGVYSWWNNPGCHVDFRPINHKYSADARWLSTSKGVYKALTWKNIKDLV